MNKDAEASPPSQSKSSAVAERFEEEIVPQKAREYIAINCALDGRKRLRHNDGDAPNRGDKSSAEKRGTRRRKHRACPRKRFRIAPTTICAHNEPEPATNKSPATEDCRLAR